METISEDLQLQVDDFNHQHGTVIQNTSVVNEDIAIATEIVSENPELVVVDKTLVVQKKLVVNEKIIIPRSNLDACQNIPFSDPTAALNIQNENITPNEMEIASQESGEISKMELASQDSLESRMDISSQESDISKMEFSSQENNVGDAINGHSYALNEHTTRLDIYEDATKTASCDDILNNNCPEERVVRKRKAELLSDQDIIHEIDVIREKSLKLREEAIAIREKACLFREQAIATCVTSIQSQVNNSIHSAGNGYPNPKRFKQFNRVKYN